ncbi:RICIN domain-containing protein [Streptomyces sp. NPDC001941]|uniref:RICIN domain-containing protein n=1 Tax=Streptomyces sp. NPDC001941 TaxID=3154659 RepID=UPI00331BB0CE
MARPGRPQGAFKGATEAANDVAHFVQQLTASHTVRELADRYGGGRTLWSEYRSGAKLIPLGVLNSVVRDRVRDGRGRAEVLGRARRLHDAALVAQVRREPAPRLDEALHRAEADLAEAGRVVHSLLTLIDMLLPTWPDTGAVQDGDRDRLGAAYDQLGAALAVRGAAGEAYAEGERELYAARLTVAGEGEATPADPSLALALARVGSALEVRRTEALGLWSEHRAGGADLTALSAGPRGGAVLERLDAAGGARLRPARRRAFPVSLPHAADGRMGAAARGALRSATTLCVALLAAVALVVTARDDHVGDDPAVLQMVPLPGQRAVPLPSAAASPSRSAAAPATPRDARTPTAPSPGAARGASAGPPRPSASRPGASPEPSSTPSAQPPPVLPDRWFRLTNATSRMCLAVPDADPNPAVGMVQTDCRAGTEQFWRLHDEGDGTYSVRNRNTGLCLSVDAGETADDAIVTQYLCGDDDGLFPDQYWSFQYRTAQHAWQLVNRNSGKCASVRPGGGKMEQVLQTYCGEGPGLLWRT